MSGEGVLRPMGGGTGAPTKTIHVKETDGVEVCRLCEIPYWQIEQIADAVVRKLREKDERTY